MKAYCLSIISCAGNGCESMLLILISVLSTKTVNLLFFPLSIWVSKNTVVSPIVALSINIFFIYFLNLVYLLFPIIKRLSGNTLILLSQFLYLFRLRIIRDKFKIFNSLNNGTILDNSILWKSKFWISPTYYVYILLGHLKCNWNISFKILWSPPFILLKWPMFSEDKNLGKL